MKAKFEWKSNSILVSLQNPSVGAQPNSFRMSFKASFTDCINIWADCLLTLKSVESCWKLDNAFWNSDTDAAEFISMGGGSPILIGLDMVKVRNVSPERMSRRWKKRQTLSNTQQLFDKKKQLRLIRSTESYRPIYRDRDTRCMSPEINLSEALS